MAVDVVIPKLGMTMQEGTVTEWLVADGEAVRVGQAVLLLVTDKLETELEAEVAGVLHHDVEAGTTMEVGARIGRISDAADEHQAPPPVHDRTIASPLARRIAVDLGLDLQAITGSGPNGRIVARDLPNCDTGTPEEPAAATATVAGSAAAVLLANRLGIDLTSVTSSRPGERISKADVEQHVATRLATPDRPDARREAARALLARPEGRVRHTAMRRAIASRMTTSLQTMAQLTMTMEVDFRRADRLRAALREDWASLGHRAPSITDLVVKATSLALRDNPTFNAEWRDDELVLLDSVDIGLAVATDAGLLVPTITQADRLPLSELAAVASARAAAARSGTLSLDELGAPTFTVTALGSYGVRTFTPIINPPNVAILGIGALHGKRPKLGLSLTWDHRAADGAPAAEFLAGVRTILEAPGRLFLPADAPWGLTT